MTRDSEDIIDCMARMKGEEQPFAVATIVQVEGAAAVRAGSKAVVRGDGEIVGWIGGGCTTGAVRKAGLRALVDGQARLIHVRPEDEAVGAADGVETFRNMCPSKGTIEVFIEPVLPRPALLVAGASPVARALADLADRLGYAVTVAALAADLDAFSVSHERIEGFDLGQAPRADSSFVVVATQGKRDREALKAALRTGAPYVAFVGSRKKGAAMKKAMAAEGVDPARLARLKSPAGLDLGSVTPEEIALSVLAEIVQQRRTGVDATEPAGEAALLAPASPGSCDSAV